MTFVLPQVVKASEAIGVGRACRADATGTADRPGVLLADTATDDLLGVARADIGNGDIGQVATSGNAIVYVGGVTVAAGDPLTDGVGSAFGKIGSRVFGVFLGAKDGNDLAPAVLFNDAPTVGALDANGNLVLPVTSGTGVKLGTLGASTFGWKDLIGAILPKTTGANTPILSTWRGGNTREFAFAAADKIDFVYHMPHDWVPGTDLFIHVHWGHNGTDITGSFVMDFYTTFARGFNQASLGDFGVEVNSTLTVSSLTIGNTPQYRHRTDEIQLSAASPTANQIDTDSLEVDGLLLVQGVMTTIPTVTGGAAKPFIFTIDIHYQSHGAGTTVDKAPDFYVL